MTETRTAAVGLDDGIVVVRIHLGAVQTLEDAKENLSAAIAETGGTPRPLLVNLGAAQPIEADARHHYTGQVFKDAFLAYAMVVENSPLGRMIGNVYMRVARHGIPAQLFTDESQAVQWLSQYRR